MPDGDLRLLHRLQAKEGLGMTQRLDAVEWPVLFGQRLKHNLVLPRALKHLFMSLEYRS